MEFSILIALVAGLATGLPTPLTLESTGTSLAPRADASVATLFKLANLSGASTFVPANSYCTDMRNIFGGFDGQVRSLSVETGVVCSFYQ